MTVFINPGSGPIDDKTSKTQAVSNMQIFVEDISTQYMYDRDEKIDIEDMNVEESGRCIFVLHANGRESEVYMPGLSLDELRFLGTDRQSAWDFTRLYVDGSSWLWKYAVHMVFVQLFEPEDDL